MYVARRRRTCDPVSLVDLYRVTAEFYDLFQRADYQSRIRENLSRVAAHTSGRILEVGAGTGIVTEVLADISRTTVHAVEPSPAMRARLLARLAARPELRQQVRVHPEPVQRVWLRTPVDLTVCVNVIATIPPSERPTVWTALATLLRSGGLLAVDAPTEHPPVSGVRQLPSTRVGPDEYTGSVTVVPTDEPHRYRWTYRYRVRRDAATVREKTESFDLWAVTPDELLAQLVAAGFEPEPVPRTKGMAFFRRR